ncbi:MAG: hypothetical protein ACKVU2_11725 [Saprospiraceae bacterium]
MVQAVQNPPSIGLAAGYTDQSIRAEVVFGTPSKHCSGNGICMVSYRPLRLTAIRCPHAPARIRRVPGEGLVFLFAKEHINTDELLAYFSDQYFLVDESFALPTQLVRIWQLDSLWIPSGHYALEEYTREWRLFLPFPGDPALAPPSKYSYSNQGPNWSNAHPAAPLFEPEKHMDAAFKD